MRINRLNRKTTRTHEGARARTFNEADLLRRAVLSCLLWEDQFYEDGVAIADRIANLAEQVEPSGVAALANEARNEMHLRHVPLLLVSVLAKTGPSLVADTIETVVRRPDELCELLAIHAARNGVTPTAGLKRTISAQMKKGIARAFAKFDAYQLAKYDRPGAIRLRDVLFLCHAVPVSEAMAATWRDLIDGTLAPPDTWEVALSRGADKKETFERLISQHKLGYLALLRNLRTMVAVGVDADLIRGAIDARRGGADRVLPFRFVAAARACPSMEPALDQSLLATVEALPRLAGRTLILVDVSYSMRQWLSQRSDMTRMDAAAALAALWPGDRRVFTFSNEVVEVPPRVGMAGVEAIVRSQRHSGTYLDRAVKALQERRVAHERIVVITDEQVSDAIPRPTAERAYMINVGSYDRGVGYTEWTRINGFSEHVMRWIVAFEATR